MWELRYSDSIHRWENWGWRFLSGCSVLVEEGLIVMIGVLSFVFGGWRCSCVSAGIMCVGSVECGGRVVGTEGFFDYIHELLSVWRSIFGGGVSFVENYVACTFQLTCGAIFGTDNTMIGSDTEKIPVVAWVVSSLFLYILGWLSVTWLPKTRMCARIGQCVVYAWNGVM